MNMKNITQPEDNITIDWFSALPVINLFMMLYL
jgi:hypothetical protein